jgi:hypothetical protein
LQELENRVVLALTFPGIAGVAFDTSGDVFISYDSATRYSGQQQSVAEVGSDGYLESRAVFTTTGSSALPGTLQQVGTSSLPSITSSTDIMELQPNGQLFVFDPVAGTSSQYDDLASYSPNDSTVYDLQTGSTTNLSGQINLADATFGDFAVYQNMLVVSVESSGWDFVMRLDYGVSGNDPTILVASPASDGLTTAPEGVGVDSTGTVLTTLPYLPAGATTATHEAVGFDISYVPGTSPAPVVPTLGLAETPAIDAAAITVDSQNNFLIAATDSSLYGDGPGIVHIDSALNAFLADPTESTAASPAAIAYQDVDGTNYLAFTDTASDTYTLAGELSLFSGQVSPTQLRTAYGISGITFPGPSGTTVTGDGSGQTIAIVEEGVDPTLGADLTTFDNFYGIQAPPSFTVVDQNNVTTENLDIVGEASLDVEWAHAVAPGASIVVYNAAYEPNDPTQSFDNLMLAMQQASKLPGVSVVSLSYGLPESSVSESGLTQQTIDSYFTTPGVTFLAAAGDSGIYASGTYDVAASYPAASPNVIAVGGTAITIDAAGDYPGTGEDGETAWGSGTDSGIDGGGGGGLSSDETEPAYQEGVVPTSVDTSDARALPDVSIDSGSAQAYDVFTSTLSGSSVSASAVGWLGDAGTSAAAPIWAGLIAIADQGRALAGGTPLTGYTQTLPAIYDLPSTDFHDILYGNNGDPAGPGYDLATGRGTPIANLLVPALADYQLPSSFSITTQPANVNVGSPITLAVQVEDSTGDPVDTGSVTVALGQNPGDGTLMGTLTEPIDNGVATFNNLTINQAGSGYTLVVTVSGIAASQTTNSFNVAAGTNATAINASSTTTEPGYGQSFTLKAAVSVVSPATGTPTGDVTFEDGSTILGTVALNDGIASLPTSLETLGTQTITIAYGGDTNDQPISTQLNVTVVQAPATITLGELSATYNGQPQSAAVTTNPVGLTGVSVTYSQNGVPVADPARAGSYTVTATLDNPDYTAQAAVETLTIAQAAPTLNWSAPAAISAGTPLSATQLDAVATFAGATVPGVYSYSPALGTVLAAGSAIPLSVTFTPTDTTDFQVVSAVVPIDVVAAQLPTSTPHAVIISEQPVFTRKRNSHGKPTGPDRLTGYSLEFNIPLSESAVDDPANFTLDTITTKKVKKTIERVLHPVTSVTVDYTPTTRTVTLLLPNTLALKSGGRLSVSPAVTEGSGAVLTGTTVFSIAPGGKSISPA